MVGCLITECLLDAQPCLGAPGRQKSLTLRNLPSKGRDKLRSKMHRVPGVSGEEYSREEGWLGEGTGGALRGR